MAKLSLGFETVSGQKKVVRVEDTKWAYQSGSDYFLEWYDHRTKGIVQEKITSDSYAAIDQLVNVTAKNFGDTPVVGALKINPLAITLANNVGGLDQQILTANQIAFAGGTWTISNSADAATIVNSASTSTITGAKPTVGSASSTNTATVAVVNGQSYTFGITLSSVALGSMVAGTNFRLRIAVGSTNYDLTTADLVSGNTILVNHTATSTGNINIVVSFTALTASDQSAVVIALSSPSFRRQTGSKQLVGVLDGTLVRYEVERPLQLLLVEGVSTLVGSVSLGSLVSFNPTGVNGGGWAGGTPAAVSMSKYLVVEEKGADSFIEVNQMSGKLILKTDTAIASLDS